MTLFNDEDIEKPPKTKLQRWLGRIFYGLLIGAAFLWFSLRILMNLGGNSTPLRQGLEEYLQKETGLQAKIGHFNYMKFYPDVSVDMGDITLSDAVASDIGGPSAVKIGAMKTSLGFWSVLFPSGRVEEFSITDVDIKENLYLRRSLQIDKIALETAVLEGQPALTVSGRYGGDSFNGSLGMAWTPGAGKKGNFSRPENSPLSFQSNFLTMHGIMSEQTGGGIRLSLDNIGLPQKLLKGDVTIQRSGEDYSLRADLKGGSSEFILDIKRTGNSYHGALRMPVLDTADMKIVDAIRNFYSLIAPTGTGSGDFKSDLDVQVDELRVKGAKAGYLSFPVHQDGGVLSAGPLKGEFSGGGISGQMTVDGSKKDLSLTAKAIVRDMKYGVLQKALFGKESISGRATFGLALTSKAAETQDLVRNLKGEVTLVAGEGDLAAGMLDLWGKGLIDIMLPRFSPSQTVRLNCVIADFKFADGLATTDPLFLDSDTMTIAGDGAITLSADPQIDLQLTPKPKNIVILSTAVNVRIKGPLGNPSINPDNFSLGKKAGSLLLGIVNPAFLVFSMTDLGLNEKHPCHAFIGKAAP